MPLPQYPAGRRPFRSTPRVPGSQPVLSSAEQREVPSVESFYFQKQMQQHTQLCVVLEDGQQLSGTIEWFDTHSIKLRCTNGTRMVIWKHAIRYLYKVGE